MTFFIWREITPAIEILILWVVFYHILVFFEGTRAFQVLRGVTYLLVAFLLSQLLGFNTLNWLLTKIFGLSVIALLIIFHQELRQGLAHLGQQHLFSMALQETEILNIIEEISTAILKLSKNHTGALIAIERETKLATSIESGVPLDCKISLEIIQSIFNPSSPLHDGGVIIRGDRLIAASCLFPLSESETVSKTLGTRHRAALGISEQTDSIVIVVSEETTDVSMASDGKLISVKDRDQLVHLLKESLVVQRKKKK